jgi:alkylhydroperoxidase family enzyme
VVRGNPTGLSSRQVALAHWARQVVLDPNATTQADVDQLRDVGFSDREIFEATVFIACRLAFATVNDALGAVPDRELIARVPPGVREAVTFGRVNTVGS